MKLENIKFESGNLSGITLYMDAGYSKIVFPNNNTDPEMISDIKNNNPKGKTIFDVGAFIGSSSLLFSKLVTEKGEVIAFEPNSYNFSRIEKNLSFNKDLSKNIKVFNLALSNMEGEISMTLSKQIDNGYSSTSRLSASHPTLHNQNLPEGFETQNVLVTTLDNFVKKYNYSPNIIKVDIEGAEYDFLTGAKETLKKLKPVLYIEIHSEYCAVKCYEILNSIGYYMTILKEEDDNRIMVKAEHLTNKKSVSQDQKEKILDRKIEQEYYMWELLKEQIKTGKTEFEKYKFKLNEELLTRIKDLENFNSYLEENFNTIKTENKNLNKNIKSIEDSLKEKNVKINRYQNSLSWKLTKPFRIILTQIKNVKRKISS